MAWISVAVVLILVCHSYVKAWYREVALMSDDHSSWDVINSDDLVSVDIDDSRNSLESENYIVVNQEDIIDGMACFMAKYVSSLPQAKVSNLFDI